jgi:hypothetical protein
LRFWVTAFSYGMEYLYYGGASVHFGKWCI